MRVLIIADDLTGANDSVVRFAELGAKSVTIFNLNHNFKELPYQAVAFTVNSRGVTPKEAYRLNRVALRDLKLTNEDMLYKKIDSALRGNIGVEIDAILDEVSPKAVLVAPALPQNGRVTKGGYQLIDGIPVHKTEMANDPVTPVLESHLPTLLAATSSHRVGYLPLESIRAGLAKSVEIVLNLIAQGCRLIVADAVETSDLDLLAKLCTENSKIVPCGSAGFAGALARHLFPLQPEESLQSDNEPVSGIIAAIIGSKSRNASLQIEQALSGLVWLEEIVVNRMAIVLPELRLKEVQNVIKLTEQGIARGKRGVIVRFDKNQGVGFDSLNAMDLAVGLGTVARNLAERFKIAAFYLSGGDIAIQTVTEIGGWGMKIMTQLEPGVSSGMILGGPFEGLKIITKAGSFGDPGTLARILRTINNRVEH